MTNDETALKPFLDFRTIYKEFEKRAPYQKIGKIVRSKGLAYEASLPRAILGSNVEFLTELGEKAMGEVVSIEDKSCLVMPYTELSGINSETKIFIKDITTSIKISDKYLGRVVDFQGNPIDKKGPIEGPFEHRSIYGEAINPLERPMIKESLNTGINAINAFMTTGKGQRIAILAGSGVGKSVLMGMVARNTNADVNVIALVGERGREVLEFIENDLGPEGLKRSVVVVATSDASPLIRMKAAYTATTIAEYFRDQNNDVIMMMDSITRFAMAAREIGMSTGEPPGQKGYGPSVFSRLPKLMERAGTKEGAGSITGIYTVLVEGGDFDEPIADAVRSISDGHILLSRELAAKNIYPAIDILNSISRVMNKVVPREHMIISGYLKDLLASYKESEDLINVGAYARGTNPKVDKAITIYEELTNTMKQEIDESGNIEEVYDTMVEIARKAEQSIDPEVFDENGP
ncbi:FliI/YscN family ATPase [Bacteriovoracaceae bacterium]|nr:FliI/YscN family ATPase [Bacteriovoracaceae bacterium]